MFVAKILDVDLEKYSLELVTESGKHLKNIQIPFIAGFNGIYGLTMIPDKGQRCLVLETQAGFIALPVIVELGENGFNPKQDSNYSRKPNNPKPGEIILSMPKAIIDMTPDGFLGMYLGDLQNTLTSLEVDDKSTRLKTANMLVISPGLNVKSEFDEESYIAKASMSMLRYPEDEEGIFVSLEDSFKIEHKSKIKKYFSFESSEDSVKVETSNVKASAQDITISFSNANLSGKKLTFDLSNLTIESGSLQIILPGAKFELSKDMCVIESGQNIIEMGSSGVTIRSNDIRLVAGNVHVEGELNVSEKITAQSVYANSGDFAGKVRAMNDDVLTKQPAQRAISEIVKSLREVALALSSHIHPLTPPTTGTLIGASPSVSNPIL